MLKELVQQFSGFPLNGVKSTIFIQLLFGSKYRVMLIIPKVHLSINQGTTNMLNLRKDNHDHLPLYLYLDKGHHHVQAARAHHQPSSPCSEFFQQCSCYVAASMAGGKKIAISRNILSTIQYQKIEQEHINEIEFFLSLQHKQTKENTREVHQRAKVYDQF